MENIHVYYLYRVLGVMEEKARILHAYTKTIPIAGRKYAEAAGLDFEKFYLEKESEKTFIDCLERGIVRPLHFSYTDEKGVNYRIQVLVYEDGTKYRSKSCLIKTENGKTYAFSIKNGWKDFPVMTDFSEEYKEIMSGSRSGFDGEFFFDDVMDFMMYKDFLGENKEYLELYRRVSAYMKPYRTRVYIDDDEGVIYGMGPRNPKCHGFQVVYRLNRFVLRQDLDCTYFSDKSLCECNTDDDIRKDSYFDEVGWTADIDEIERIIKIMGDRSFDQDSYLIPLSFNAYMEVTSLKPLQYQAFCIDDPERKLDDWENREKDRAIKRLLYCNK